MKRLREWGFVIGCVLAADCVLLGGLYIWTTTVPDDALETITISRDWMLRLQEERGRQSEQVNHLRDMLREMASSCELIERYSRKGM